jgi:hypothetical protein
VCESCHAQFVTPADQLRAAAFAWASAVLPQLLQSGAGRSAADEALGRVDPDGRALYVNFVARAVATASATETDFDSFAEWMCPTCGDRAWRASWAPAF